MDRRTTAAKNAKRFGTISGERVSKDALSNITSVSDFRKYLTANYSAILSASGGYRISWANFLKNPEVREQHFRDIQGKDITPRLAGRIWRKVKADMSKQARP